MKDPCGTNQELIEEISALQQRIKELEHSEAQRKRAEEALESERTLLRNLIDNVPDRIYAKDAEGRFIICNEAMIRRMGKTSMTELVGKSDFDFLPPETAQRFHADEQAIIHSGIPMINREEPLLTEGGTITRWNLASKVPLLDKQGNRIGIVGVGREITDRKQVEEALRESEERYRVLVENASDIVFRTNDTGHFTFVNPATLLITGYEKKELIGRHFSTLIRPDMLDETMKFFGRQSVKGIKNTYLEYTIIAKDGHEVWLGQNTQLILEYGHVVGFQAVARDITERKKMEEALRNSEEKFRALSESSPAAIFLIQGTKYIYINPAFEKNTGYTIEDLADMNFWDIVHPDMREVVRNRGQNRLAGQNPPSSYELKIMTKSGQERWANFAATSITLDNKSTIIGSVFDTTERKKAEEALRKSEELYSRLVDTIPDFIVLTDLDGQILFVNDRALQISGYSRGEVEGRNMLIFISPENHEMVIKNVPLMMEGRIGPQEYNLIMKNGRKIPFEVNGDVLRNEDGTPFGLVNVCRNIVDRKQTEKTMQRQNVYLASLNEIALGLMKRTDLTDLFQAIVTRAMRFSGTDEAWICIYDSRNGDFEYRAAIGQREYQIGSRAESGLGITGEVWLTEQTVLIDDYHVWPKRANIKEYDIRRATVAIPLRYEGRLAGILGLSHHDAAKRFEKDDLAMLERLAELASIALDNARLYDRMKLELAERKQAEEENLRLEERLQRSEKMEALGQLAGGVAHDLNNVLGILSGYSELLLMEIPEGQRARGHVEKILQSTEKGASIIQDLLTLARRGVTATDVINLNSVVSDFIKTPVFEKIKDYHPRVIFRTEYDQNLLNIKGSSIHLEKTLMNLVSNAAEAISGEGEVTIQTESRYLDKAIKGYDEVREGDYAVLTVSDTGMGIPAENIEKIFEPFYTKKTMGRSGTGLGLTIVWGTVKDHNGYIDLQTEVGKGTVFSLYFPATREELNAPQHKVPIERYMGKGESVLVVDDIAEQRDVASELLTQLGYKVHVVSSGEEAVEYLKGNNIDIMVLDMIMAPGIDGLETYQRVLKINPKQKAILVSGFSETERVKEARKLGAGAYVKKPYIMEKIGIAIRDELDRK